MLFKKIEKNQVRIIGILLLSLAIFNWYHIGNPTNEVLATISLIIGFVGVVASIFYISKNELF